MDILSMEFGYIPYDLVVSKTNLFDKIHSKILKIHIKSRSISTVVVSNPVTEKRPQKSGTVN